MKKQLSKAISLMLAVLLFFGMIPVNADAAVTTLGTPGSVQANKAWDYETGKLVTRYGSVAWKPMKPYVSGEVAWITVQVYRNGKLVGGHQYGVDPAYLSPNQYMSYDMAPLMDWDSGTYYYTVQMSNRGAEGTYASSVVAKSAEWTYSKPSKKMAMPTNVKWATASGFSLPEATWTVKASGASHRLYYMYSPTQTDDPTGCGSQWYVFGGSVKPYLDNGPGYYYFSVQTISTDLKSRAHSDITQYSEAFHYKLGTPSPKISVNSASGTPVLSWSSVKYADYYEVYRSRSEGSGYTRVGKPTGTTFADTSAEAGTTYYYRVRASRNNGMKSSYSKALCVTTPAPRTELKITAQPQSVTVAKGATAKATVQAIGDGLTYKWYYKDKGASDYTYTSSFKGNTYQIEMTDARNGRRVLCRVYDKYGNVVQSNSALLSMKSTVKITSQPQSVTVAEGTIAKATVKATGDGLTYKWYYKDKGASDYTYTSSFKGNTYQIEMTDARNGRRVLCRVYDKYGNVVQSNSALLSMKSTVKITGQPQSVTVAEGATAKVTVKATGDGLTYKWYYKDAGASDYVYTSSFKSNTYSVQMTTARSGRRVLCRVYDKYGNVVQSSSALLKMK